MGKMAPSGSNYASKGLLETSSFIFIELLLSAKGILTNDCCSRFFNSCILSSLISSSLRIYRLSNSSCLPLFLQKYINENISIDGYATPHKIMPGTPIARVVYLWKQFQHCMSVLASRQVSWELGSKLMQLKKLKQLLKTNGQNINIAIEKAKRIFLTNSTFYLNLSSYFCSSLQLIALIF